MLGDEASGCSVLGGDASSLARASAPLGVELGHPYGFAAVCRLGFICCKGITLGLLCVPGRAAKDGSAALSLSRCLAGRTQAMGAAVF